MMKHLPLRPAVRLFCLSAAPLAGYSADVMAARLRSTTINFSVEEPRDDIAILVLRNDA